MRAWCFCVLLGLALNAGADSVAGFTASHIKMVNVVAPEWPEFTNKDGTGLYWDILRAVYEPAGIRVKPATVPWNRALKMVTEYRVYNAIIGETRNSSEPLLYPRYAIDVEYLSVVYPLKARITWKGLDTLKDKTVGWMKGYDVLPAAQRNFKLREFRSSAEGLQWLQQGKIDMMVDEWDAIQLALEEAGVGMDYFEVQDVPYGRDVYVAFAEGPVSEYLISEYNRRIPELIASGELQALYDKWQEGEMPAQGKALMKTASAQ